MRRFTAIFLCVALSCLNLSCASVMSGGRQDVVLRSTPSAANVEIDGLKVGRTPITTDVSRRSRHEIKFSKEGYETKTVRTIRGFNWWYVGNLILIYGIIIDLVTGAVYKVEPDEFNVTLKELKT